MFGKKKGSAVIAGAVDLFNTAITQINEGIELTRSETDAAKVELDIKTQEFETTKAKIETIITEGDESIISAMKVRDNIANLLK